jgi:type II secretory pathway pseudopilin PulG
MVRQLRNGQRGAVLLTVLVALTLLGLSAGIAGSSWKSVMQRAREQELLFRGDQYRRAIASYHAARGGYPQRLEDLLKDPRALHTLRHLRRLYLDPMTGRAFETIRDKGGRIKGVYSASTLHPFKKEGFAEPYKDFAKAVTYRDWRFEFAPGSSGASEN